MSVNKVILLGNVGRDPEVRYIENNVAVANFSIATTERGYTSRAGQTVPDRTEWHNIVAWRGLAQIVEKYVKKGTPLYIEGKIRTRSYDDKDGIKRYTTEIYAENIELLGRKGDGSPTGESLSTGNSQAPYSTPEYGSQPVYGNNVPPAMPNSTDILGEAPDDDLPF
jgi:single-strand DNA-binding protein